MKKFISSFLAVAIIMALLPMGVFELSAKAATSGHFTYVAERGIATITDCSTSVSGDIEIPMIIDGNLVTKIGDKAFLGCENITSISIPQSIESIGAQVFYKCKGIKSITVDPNNRYYTSQDGVLFNKDKTSLICYPCIKSDVEYTIPDTVVTLEACSFYYCRKLVTLNIPSSVKTISNDVFESCRYLENVNFEYGVQSIGNGAFHNCVSLRKIEFPDSVKTIGSTVFQRCLVLDEVKFSDGLESIGTHLFIENCAPTKITIPYVSSYFGLLYGADEEFFDAFDYMLSTEVIVTRAKNIPNNAFFNCPIKKITLPDTLESIGYCAFDGCDFEEITIPESVTYIGENAFSSCLKLKNIELPSGITTIEGGTFYDCRNLSDVVIPAGVTSIKEHAFGECDSLTDVWFLGTKEQKEKIKFGYYNNDLLNAAWHYGMYPGEHQHTYKNDCDTDCEVCGAIREITHSYTETVIPATCIQLGYTTFTCSVCGDSYNGNYTYYSDHNYKDTIVYPTTTEQGYTLHTCTVCGDSYKDNYKDPIDPSVPSDRVSGVVVTPSDIDITVSWNEFIGADRYYVKAIKPDGSTLTTKTITNGSLSAVFTGLEFDVEYTFIVYARLVDKTYLLPENADEFKASLVIGDRVVGIKSSVKGRTITVSWLEYPDATNYYVFVYPKGADPTVSANRVTTVNAGNNTSIGVINVIAPEVDYDIYVSAKVGGKYQTLENALYTSAIIPVTAPNSFELTSIKPTVAKIKWNAVKGADRYWARLVDENGNTILTKQSLKALISFTGLTPGKTYYVQLQARVPKSSGGNVYSGYCDPIMTQPITMPLA